MSGNDDQISAEQRQLLQNTEALLQDPETRSKFFGLVKAKNPTMVIPEVDVKTQLDAAIAVERAEREKLAQELRDERTRTEIKERRAGLKAKGMTDAEITEVEKTMHEKGIVSHDTAADYYMQSRQLAGGSTPDGSSKKVVFDPLALAKEKFGGNIAAMGKSIALEDYRAAKKAA